MSVHIRSILRGGNHFDVLQLPRPYADLMGEPVWEVGPDEVNRAFRKRSLHCHPDKSTHDDAPHAFSLLKKAKAVLLHELDGEAYVRAFVKEQATHWEGNWSSAEAASTAKERVSRMREDAQQSQSDTVLDAMLRRQEKARREQSRRERKKGSAPRARTEDEMLEELEQAAGAAVGDADADAAAPSRSRAAAPAARKRPKFL